MKEFWLDENLYGFNNYSKTSPYVSQKITILHLDD